MAIQSSDLKYFDGSNGFLVVATGGTASTGGTIVMGLQNISFSYEVDTTTITVFENDFVEMVAPTYKRFSMEASGIFLDITNEAYHPASGSSYVVGATSGAQLLELIKQRSTSIKVFLKMGANNYQSGTALLTSFSASADAGNPWSFDISLQGTSDLTKATS
ncbi:MAG TPA: hypothetical protein VD927_11280 [Chryseosolibacter sp.]|nr:hypothetical protein [Chryseosolibacter sp.]